MAIQTRFAARPQPGRPRRSRSGVIAAALLGALALAGCSAQGGPKGVPGTNVARAALNGGSPQIALRVATGIIAQDPQNTQAHLILGEAYTALGQPIQAAAAFQDALRLDPGSAEADIGLGRLRLGTDPQAAEHLFLQALDVQPQDTVAWNDLGIARDLQGRHADAQAAYQKALGLDPTMQAAQVNLALSLAMSGQGSRGVAMLRPQATAPGATAQLRHDLAAAMAMSGDTAGAERILSADLPPDQVARAIADFQLARAQAGQNAPPPAAAVPLMPAPLTPPQPGPSQPGPSQPGPPQPGTSQPGVPAPLPAGPAAARPTSQNLPPGAPEAQISAAASAGAARSLWAKLSHDMPDLFAGHPPLIQQAEVNGHAVWRLRATGFASTAEAAGFCASLHAHGQSCTVYRG
ncbi:MAG: tetratricopeptide repeat protein [Rhodospirillales bacterium]|nr:tetratricopeptide repeat protein [Rhodospirillales bacterium]